jgi:hypothetical protein
MRHVSGCTVAYRSAYCTAGVPQVRATQIGGPAWRQVDGNSAPDRSVGGAAARTGLSDLVGERWRTEASPTGTVGVSRCLAVGGR